MHTQEYLSTNPKHPNAPVTHCGIVIGSGNEHLLTDGPPCPICVAVRDGASLAEAIRASQKSSALGRVRSYLSGMPLPAEGKPRGNLRTAQALIAAGLPVPNLALCWAEAAGCPGKADHARRLLRGALPWPAEGRKRGPLVRAVETWEAAQKPAFNATLNTMSGLCRDDRVVD